MVLYNQIDHLFSYFETAFTFLDAGELVAASRVDTVDMEPYGNPRAFVRAALEICMVGMWAVFCALAARDMLAIQRRNRNAGAAAAAAAAAHGRATPGVAHSDLPATIRSYLWRESVILSSLALQGVEILFWLILAFGYETEYTIPARVDVYQSLTDTVRPLELWGNSDAGLMQVESILDNLKMISTLNAIYDMMHGLSLIVFVVRLLALFHFQPRLGVVSRTLAKCATDLIHFLVVLSIMFATSAVIAYLVFGGVVQEWSTIGHAFQILFNMLVFQVRACWGSDWLLETASCSAGGPSTLLCRIPALAHILCESAT